MKLGSYWGIYLTSSPWVESLYNSSKSEMYVSNLKCPRVFSPVEQEIKTNRERCQEVIDKVLRKSRMLYEHLLVIAQSPNRDRLNRFESTLTDYGRSVLNKEYQVYRFVDPQLGFWMRCTRFCRRILCLSPRASCAQSQIVLPTI